MDGAKKKDFDESLNAKIQGKFDLVFGETPASAEEDFSELAFDGDIPMSESAKKDQSLPKIDLDFGGDGDVEFSSTASEASTQQNTAKETTGRLSIVPDESEGLEFNLDFGDEPADIPAVPQNTVELKPQASEGTKSDSHFELDFNELSATGEVEQVAETLAHNQAETSSSAASFELPTDDLFDAEIETAMKNSPKLKESTQPTILYDGSSSGIDLGNLETPRAKGNTGTHSSADLMSTEEAKANIESTIKDILRPKELSESTQEIDISGFDDEPIAEIKSLERTGEFDINQVEFADKDEQTVVETRPASVAAPVASAPIEHFEQRPHASFINEEESSRFQATIRQLREEREALLNEMKMLKSSVREVEQDNLTLKAALDEAKIEISILRKRHMVEMEDMRYRMTMAEEKRIIAEEKAKTAEMRKEKLEQRVRIDFNQVKQREKELETKLEMMAIDIDSQVQSRDQKILELRRKIDSLEFNMENVTIREQKTQDDKRKLEDKLNKIMKTLRHSIKNLEDDIDQVAEESRDDKDSSNES